MYMHILLAGPFESNVTVLFTGYRYDGEGNQRKRSESGAFPPLAFTYH
jgi:hypothetical protein